MAIPIGNIDIFEKALKGELSEPDMMRICNTKGTIPVEFTNPLEFTLVFFQPNTDKLCYMFAEVDDLLLLNEVALACEISGALHGSALEVSASAEVLLSIHASLLNRQNRLVVHGKAFDLGLIPVERLLNVIVTPFIKAATTINQALQAHQHSHPLVTGPISATFRMVYDAVICTQLGQTFKQDSISTTVWPLSCKSTKQLAEAMLAANVPEVGLRLHSIYSNHLVKSLVSAELAIAQHVGAVGSCHVS